MYPVSLDANVHLTNIQNCYPIHLTHSGCRTCVRMSSGGTRHLRLVYRGRRVIPAKEFYPRRETPIRRAKRNEYRYLHPFIPDETRTHESTVARVHRATVSVRVGLTCIKIHRPGKIYFPVPGKLKIDPAAPPRICDTPGNPYKRNA